MLFYTNEHLRYQTKTWTHFYHYRTRTKTHFWYIPLFANTRKIIFFSLYPVIDTKQYTRCKNYIGDIPPQHEILACMVPNPMHTFTKFAFVFTKDAMYSNSGKFCVKYKDIKKTKTFNLPHSFGKHVKIGLKDGNIIVYQMSKGHENLYDGVIFEKMIRSLAGLHQWHNAQAQCLRIFSSIYYHGNTIAKWIKIM